MDAAALAKLTPALPWKAYFVDEKVPDGTPVNVAQPQFLEAANREIAETPLADWKAYLRWHLVHSAAPNLSKKFVDEDFAFFQATLQGVKEQRPRWKRCVAATDEALGFALGKIYVKEYFPPESKARMDELVRNLIAALRDDLATIGWMGPETRKAALAKLDAFTPKIGYPTTWRDYSPLSVSRQPHAFNVFAADHYEFHRDIAKIGKPVDRTEWGMTPPTVNAYYNASKNEIVFPAGILQPPFFDGKADDAVNYGGIGTVIGHEMTHGFDDQGRKFDGKGNLTNWWTPEDLKNYEARSSCVEKQLGSYTVQEGLNVNGKLVLGESTADLGGLAISYRAMEKALEAKRPGPIDGFTPEQRFFLSWGRIWAENDRPEYERVHTATNPHPLGRHRAIAAPSNLPEFAKAFDCKAGDPMVRAEACRIW
jgi:predicted metalloendopeptidase